ncbi:MAG TPA: CBS domain-containing protein [Thermoanaerobaculia bacterium]|nr:CBS domain-containing protein [Thermoanaerobaculia bacterium]
MGRHDVDREHDAERLRQFTKKLLADLRALESMLADGRIEGDRRRIGAEQEMFLVDRRWRAAPVNLQVLAELADPHFTTELGRFNLEFNLDPLTWGEGCLRVMEEQLDRLVLKVREAAARHGADIVLTGILPTLEKGDLTIDQMTPNPRYHALNEAMTRLRGSDYRFHLKGPDELNITHDSVMVEACNTSFQVHFQIGPQEFPRLYNIAQAVAGPVLAVAANSPLLFGKRLWRETRIALFQQSIDTRLPTAHIRDQSPRVRFGRGWVRESVLEILQEDISRFRVLLAADIDEDPQEVLASGGVPTLQALRLFNSTIYRWNRPCYGISDGRPHLRIENRVLPAGPTVRDEVANAAFWFGLMAALAEEHEDITRAIHYDHVKENFLAAARLGLGAPLHWIGESKPQSAADLVCQRLLPLARRGLAAGGIDSADADLYLGVLEERVSSGRTGAQWLLDSYAASRDRGTRAERLAALVASTVRQQREGKPVHQWPLADIEEAGGWQAHNLEVAQLMTTDLFTLHQDELVELAAAMMDWRKIRHVPVEDNQHRLVGLVTHRSLLRMLARAEELEPGRSLPVSDIMEREVVTVTPQTSTLQAIQLMRRHKIGCLPVVDEGRLVGIITERDFMNVAGQLLQGVLQGKQPSELMAWAQGEFASETTDD